MREVIQEIYINCGECKVNITTEKGESMWSYYPCTPEGLAIELERIAEAIQYGRSLYKDEGESIK